MTTDDILAYGCTAVCLLFMLISLKYSRRFAVINLLIFLLYNGWLYYCLTYRSEYGSGLAWWFYLLAANLLQIVIVGVFLLIRVYKAKK